jgi:C-terminal processing protease CtpA/Prc
MKSLLSKNILSCWSRKRSLMIITVLLCIKQFAYAQQVKFSADKVKEDLEYLYSTLEKAHYNLYAYVPKEKIEKVYEEVYHSIGKDSLSQLETYRIFQRLTASANIGHTELDFPIQAYIEYAPAGSVFPLELAFENGKAFIRENTSDNPAFQSGVEVLSIDGKAIEDIQKQIHLYLAAETSYYKDAKTELYSFPRMYWVAFGQQDEFEVSIKNPEGAIEEHSIKAVPVMHYERQRAGELLNDDHWMEYFGEVAYLHPGPFAQLQKDFGLEEFRHFIDSAFADLKQKGTEHLIIDLRNNRGGDNAYGEHLISYFADKPFHWYSEFQLKTSEVLKAHTRKHAGSELSDYNKAILEHENGEIYAYDFPAQEAVAEAKRFKGNVYVLVNRLTISMAVVSAAVVQDYNFGTIVGEESGDVPTLYASQFSFPLPNTGIPVKLSKGYIIRPNGDERVKALVPDIKVRDHLLDEKDEILEYTLESLRK